MNDLKVMSTFKIIVRFYQKSLEFNGKTINLLPKNFCSLSLFFTASMSHKIYRKRNF